MEAHGNLVHTWLPRSAIKKCALEFLLWLSGLRTSVVSVRIWIWPLASLSGQVAAKVADAVQIQSGHSYIVPVRPLAWELPYATGTAVKRKKKKMCIHFFSQLPISILFILNKHLAFLSVNQLVDLANFPVFFQLQQSVILYGKVDLGMRFPWCSMYWICLAGIFSFLVF